MRSKSRGLEDAALWRGLMAAGRELAQPMGDRISFSSRCRSLAAAISKLPFRRTSLHINHRNRSSLIFPAAAFACLVGISMPTLAQDGTKPSIEKWRPKNGLYADFGKGFSEQCKNLGDFAVELGEKTITGDEWICDVTKLTDTGPGAIRLDLSCSDINLSADLPNHGLDPAEPLFQEIMTFRKIDEKSLFVRKSQNGKFDSPESRVAFCPPKAQRAYIESKKTKLITPDH